MAERLQTPVSMTPLGPRYWTVESTRVSRSGHFPGQAEAVRELAIPDHSSRSKYQPDARARDSPRGVQDKESLVCASGWYGRNSRMPSGEPAVAPWGRRGLRLAGSQP